MLDRPLLARHARLHSTSPPRHIWKVQTKNPFGLEFESLNLRLRICSFLSGRMEEGVLEKASMTRFVAPVA